MPFVSQQINECRSQFKAYFNSLSQLKIVNYPHVFLKPIESRLYICLVNKYVRPLNDFIRGQINTS